MITVTCVSKLRDKNGFIYGYKLKDEMGNIRDIKPDALKNAIASQQCICSNLTLTSDWRLVDKDITKKPFDIDSINWTY